MPGITRRLGEHGEDIVRLTMRSIMHADIALQLPHDVRAEVRAEGHLQNPIDAVSKRHQNAEANKERIHFRASLQCDTPTSSGCRSWREARATRDFAMRSKETSNYTIVCMIIGLVAGFAYYFFQNDKATNIVQYIFGTSNYFRHPEMISIVLWHSFAMALCLGVCWLSSRLDFVNPADDKAGRLISISMKILIALIVIVIIFYILDELGYGIKRGGVDSPAKSLPPPHFADDPFYLVRGFFFAIFMLIVILIVGAISLFVGSVSGIYLFVISPIALGLGFAALLCSWRALVYSTATSKLRGPVAQAKGPGMISADQVVRGVGEKSTSAAHAVGVRKDLSAQLEEARRAAARLKAEEERLSKAMHHDTERLKEEAELLKVLEEIDTLKIRKKALEEAMRKQTR